MDKASLLMCTIFTHHENMPSLMAVLDKPLNFGCWLGCDSRPQPWCQFRPRGRRSGENVFYRHSGVLDERLWLRRLFICRSLHHTTVEMNKTCYLSWPPLMIFRRSAAARVSINTSFSCPMSVASPRFSEIHRWVMFPSIYKRAWGWCIHQVKEMPISSVIYFRDLE